MDLISLFLFIHENNEIKSPTKIYDLTVSISLYDSIVKGQAMYESNPFYNRHIDKMEDRSKLHAPKS